MKVPVDHYPLTYLWREAQKHRPTVGKILSKKFGEEFWRCLGVSADDVLWDKLCRFTAQDLTLSNMGNDPGLLESNVCRNYPFSIAFLNSKGIDTSFLKKYQMWPLRAHPSASQNWKDESADNPNWFCKGSIWGEDICDRVWSEPGFARPPGLISVNDGCIDLEMITEIFKMEHEPFFPGLGETKSVRDLAPYDRWKLSIPKRKVDEEWDGFWGQGPGKDKAYDHLPLKPGPKLIGGEHGIRDAYTALFNCGNQFDDQGVLQKHGDKFPHERYNVTWKEVCRKIEKELFQNGPNVDPIQIDTVKRRLGLKR